VSPKASGPTCLLFPYIFFLIFPSFFLACKLGPAGAEKSGEAVYRVCPLSDPPARYPKIFS